MTVWKTEIEQERVDMLKTIRAAVRLKHSLAADRELNAALPVAAAAFDAAVLQGELPDPLKFTEVLGE